MKRVLSRGSTAAAMHPNSDICFFQSIRMLKVHILELLALAMALPINVNVDTPHASHVTASSLDSLSLGPSRNGQIATQSLVPENAQIQPSIAVNGISAMSGNAPDTAHQSNSATGIELLPPFKQHKRALSRLVKDIGILGTGLVVSSVAIIEYEKGIIRKNFDVFNPNKPTTEPEATLLVNGTETAPEDSHNPPESEPTTSMPLPVATGI